MNSNVIMRSLIRQALSSFPFDELDPNLAVTLIGYLEEVKTEYFSMDSLKELFSRVSALFEDWFVVVDGIDECHDSHQRILYDFFSGLLSDVGISQRIKVLFSGRETTIQVIDRNFDSVTRMVTGTRETSIDIMAFAEDVIREKQSLNELVVGDEILIQEILETIASKEEGM